MLQDLLKLGLVNIGSDDSVFAKMESATTRLSAQFEELPQLMITATLVAIDENVDENDPFFELVEDLVVDEWKTLRNTHNNRPRELLRSIAISALNMTIDGNPERSAIVCNTAASRLMHDQTSLGKASKLLKEFFQKAFLTSESEALRRGGIVTLAPKKTRGKENNPSVFKSLSISELIESEELIQDVARAAGPQFPQGQVLNDSNPNLPNQGVVWSDEFTPRMTKAIVKAVHIGSTRLAESIASDLAEYMKTIEMRLQQAESEAAGRMQLDVLWWSQARYSPSQNTSYSSLPAAVAAFVAAVDLTAIVPAFTPASVTHVLGETMAACLGNERLSLLDHLKLLKQSPPQNLGGALAGGNTNAARVPLLNLVAEVIVGNNVSEEDFKLRAGVDPVLTLEPAEFAMWLFRELQAQRIAEEAVHGV